MKIIKHYQYETTSDDIYILDLFHDHIVINGNNCIRLLNKELEIRTTIDIEKFPSIYTVYKHFQKYRLFLYDPNNKERQLLKYISFENNIIQEILISKFIPTFSQFYIWREDFIIFATYENTFYRIDFDPPKTHISLFPEYIIKRYYSELYHFFTDTQNYYKWHVNMQEYSIIYESDNYIFYFDYFQKSLTWVECIDEKYHAVIYYNAIFAFIAEQRLTLIYHHIRHTVDIPYQNYIFARACFVAHENNTFLVALMCDKSNSLNNKIVAYQIKEL